MTQSLLLLLVALLLILLASELFTNALEHAGERLGVSQGVTGSIFAAVGTALPETTVPLLAVFAGSGDARIDHEIGVGAILGAPLMLATLSSGLMAISALPRRGWHGRLRPERSGHVRDLNTFLLAFALCCGALFIPSTARATRLAVSVVLVAIYIGYVYLTVAQSKALSGDGHAMESDTPLWLSRMRLKTNPATIGVQLCLGLSMLLAAAKAFISGVHDVAPRLGVTPLLLSLLVIPVATELPEKINSILWVRRGKDTLALGNITGAMVFQGTLLPALGILLTPWTPRPDVLYGMVVTLAAAGWTRCLAFRSGTPAAGFLVNAVLYAGYLVVMLSGVV